MSVHPAIPPAADTPQDVLIVGAGLSGIGAARHLQRRCPGRRWAIVEARQTLGGTWDLFRWPGVRSDSDMHTLGYDFKPWRAAKAIADGPSILQDIRETADEAGIPPQIRFGQRVLRAAGLLPPRPVSASRPTIRPTSRPRPGAGGRRRPVHRRADAADAGALLVGAGAPVACRLNAAAQVTAPHRSGPQNPPSPTPRPRP